MFAELASLESGSFWFRARNQLLVWALRRHSPDLRSFLEIGCGTGFVLDGIAQAFPGVRIAGSEILSAGLPFAARRMASADLFQMDARRVPFDTEFDVIGAFDVLEHIEEDESVLSEIHRALVAGGTAIFTVPQHQWLWSSIDEHACHVRRYRTGELREKLIRSGFQVELETSFVSLLLPMMLASRLSRKDVPEQDANAEMRLPRILNQLLLGVMAVERGLIKSGIRFPIGGSRLVVARKIS
ncbi:class I SAM-dependent methyltransferase [Stenotrophomonas geniculata]|uniref:class I SAM-dependent methyltransferase n=1 Tax=Stenotrophomonas geniculata TaxID=86188 RepID=UPI002949AF1C|nr:class I SAM-dependent methyltransferase [Stenotrophomonas geniculata]MDV6188729.1 class I SAM-dependent methyltransferase [Stenotrophomonas geniculata]